MTAGGRGAHSAALARPERTLIAGFLALIAAGTALLALPAASRSGSSIDIFHSLFTSTSAVCVTGLVAVDTGTTFTPFGQGVLLVLIQVGGLGFMMFAAIAMTSLGRRLSLRERMLVRDSMSADSLSDILRMARTYLLLALALEIAGAAVLALRFVPLAGVRRGLWLSLFHAVSAFCNAGFDLFGGFSSLTAFAHDPLVLVPVAALIILGGLGFAVILEAAVPRRTPQGLSLHTRIVLVSTALLLVSGTAFFLLAEGRRAETLGGMGAGGQLLNAFFQSVTMRTAGFNTVDLARMGGAAKLFSVLLMLIGASPASTGGGMKTTTVVAFVLMTAGFVRGSAETVAGRRRMPDDVTRRALSVVALFLTAFLAGTLLLSLIEGDRFPLEDIMFEASSALGTVGVSALGTPNLQLASRAVLIPMMFLGRVGPLTVAVSLARRQNRVHISARYPEERIMIG